MGVYVGDKRYAPYIGDKRRRYMGGVKEERLIYHWSGEDDLVNNTWVDRIQGFPFSKQNNPIHENSGYTCANSQGFFKANLNTDVAGNGTIGLHIGRHWRIVIDCTPLDIRTNNMNLIIDFGSLGQSNKSFGFGISGSNGQDRMIDNYKTQGNKNTYSVATGRNASNVPSPPVNTRAVIEYGCKPSNNGDVQYIMYNNVEQMAAQAHTPIKFEADFSLDNGLIGNGNASNYAIVRIAIFDIKIYNTD